MDLAIQYNKWPCCHNLKLSGAQLPLMMSFVHWSQINTLLGIFWWCANNPKLERRKVSHLFEFNCCQGVRIYMCIQNIHTYIHTQHTYNLINTCMHACMGERWGDGMVMGHGLWAMGGPTREVCVFCGRMRYRSAWTWKHRHNDRETERDTDTDTDCDRVRI